MNKIALFIGLLLLPVILLSQNSNYSRVKIYLDGKSLSQLSQQGIEINQYNQKEGWVITEIPADELALARNAGFRSEVLIEDVQKFYRERNANRSIDMRSLKSQNDLSSEWPVPANFTLGTCGGFLTIDAMLAQLDQMRALYPNLITVKHVINDTLTTEEGRDIYYVKISDNPDVAENEPQVLYTGMHHAREAIGMQHLMYYMWYLLENYNTNQEIKNVVDNTEMYFVPIFNVDGYAYNLAMNPDGDGMWRKNRRNSGGGNYGVDLNRNYGYMWGYDDSGSSPDPSSDLYRGPSAFSEPETRMMKYFCQDHNFQICLNYHSYGGYFLYTWGYISNSCPDASLLRVFATEMTVENNYTYGSANNVLYATNGDSDDWMYGEQASKNKILTYTPEVGNGVDGFWPLIDRIIPLCQENMMASFMAAKLVGKYGKISDASSLFLYKDNGYLNFDVKRLGMQATDFTVSVSPIGSSFASVGGPVTISGLALLEKRTDSIPYQIATGLHIGDTIRYALILDNGMYTVSDTVERIYGYPYVVFSDNLNNKNNWTGNWSLTTGSYYSPGTSMTDSPFGNYAAYTYSSETQYNTIPIPTSMLTVLEFRAHWSIEAEYDYVQLKISSNSGATWTPLAGHYTHPGSTSQSFNKPVYDGMQTEWVREDILLDPWQGSEVKFQFSLISDGATQLDGFYYDDFNVLQLLDPTSINSPQASRAWLGVPSPNPAEDIVRITYLLPNSLAHANLSLMNSQGKKVLEQGLDHSGQWTEFSVKDLPAGIYYISLSSEGITSEVRKLVIY